MTIPNGFDLRSPPHNRDAERSVISLMLRDVHSVPEIIGLIRKEDFYVQAHGLIFGAISDLADKGRNADMVSVAEELTSQKKIEEIGGIGYIADLSDCYSSSGYQSHCQMIREYSDRRKIIHACGQWMQDAFDPSIPANELIGQCEAKIGEISESSVMGESVELHDALRETYERLDARRGRLEGEVSGVPTGFIDLDNLLCGFQNSELIILGARPSVGKTALALGITRNVAVENRIPIFFVSLEQARVELAERLLCCQGRVDSHKLRRGHLSAEEESRLLEAGDTLSHAKVIIDDTPGQTMLRIAANARKVKRKHGIRFIIVDYLQLIVSDHWRANRQEQVAENSRRLKQLARELKVPVLALCQVNRGPEDRPDKRPRLSDLRESGAIEADADTVLLMHADSEVDGLIEINVAKQRNGPRDKVNLMFVKQFMKFENAAIPHGAMP